MAGGLGSAIGTSGILIALAAEPMGLLAVPVFLAPLLLTQFAFRRYSMVQATYHQTIRSLSRVTELGGYTEAGPLAAGGVPRARHGPRPRAHRALAA